VTSTPPGVDLDRVRDWMDQHGLGAGPLEDPRLLGGGTQNVLLQFGRAGRSYVLRRPPLHKRRNSDETMRREARVLAALADTDVPHPRFVAGCPTTDVIGAAFYLMEPIEGFNPTVELPRAYAQDPTMGRGLGLAMADGIAALGRLDPTDIGLADLGRPEGWLERQVARWRAQLESYRDLDGYEGPELPAVEETSAWLEAHRPSSWRVGLIHGDYTLTNVLARHEQGELAAIVDWELTTQGDPLLDLGHLLATWPEDDNAAQVAGDVHVPGLPTRDELVARYALGSDRDLSDLPWYRVLACYRLGLILEGTHARACAGLAPVEVGDRLHGMAVALLEQARALTR
jgi:aminoglycoside phosphotransferase (APT) family kinase protein